MVSEGKILGQSSLIFITVGSTHFQFNRLFSALDKTLINPKDRPFLIVQAGNSNYQWKYKNIKIYNYLSPPKLIQLIKKSDKVIAHAGPATIFLITKYAKNMPLIIPRLKDYQEHVDNHQLFFVKFLKKKLPEDIKRFFVANENLAYSLKKYLNQKPKKNTLNQYLFHGIKRKGTVSLE